jgi:hypothetical protein
MKLWRNGHNLWILQRKNVDFATQKCGFCNAKMWIKERLAKSSNNNPQFFLCCENDKVLLPSLRATPQELEVLLTSKERNVVKF